MSENAAPPGTLTPPEETTASLVKEGTTKIVEETAPSLSKIHDGLQTPLAELDATQLVITRTPNPRPVPELDSPEVRSMATCTDHMITAQWTANHGWAAPALVPYGPIPLMPTASVLHYATTCFEGLKMFRGHDGRLRLFRPALNAARMVRSATGVALPAFSPQDWVALVTKLCAVDGPRWLPRERAGEFLYVRPTLIGNNAELGLRRPSAALLYVLANCTPRLDRGLAGSAAKPGLRLLASRDDEIRAWPGGLGWAKVGVNYGPTIVATDAAHRCGYDQVLWLFGPEAVVAEAGASNFFVVWDAPEGGRRELVTAPVGQRTILEGITRRSVIELAKERLGAELEVVERSFTMEEVRRAVAEGRLVEAFAAGTAFFIAPVSEIHFRGADLGIPMSEGAGGKYAGLFKTWLENIMYGVEQHPWTVEVDEE